MCARGSRWPWPGDSPLDIARRLVQSYRQELQKISPERCAVLDRRAQELGQGWVIPQDWHVDLDDLLSRDEAAEFAQVERRTLDEWRRRGLKVTATPDGPRYRVRDLLDYQAQRRRARIDRRDANPP